MAYAEQPTLQERAIRIASEYKISKEKLFNLIESESQWNPNQVSETNDFGLVQINIGKYNPGITEEQALDPDFAIRFASQAIQDGTEDRFTVCNCYALARAILGDIPLMNKIKPNSPPRVNGLVILNYKGVKHVAIITKLLKEGVEVRESNYEPCKLGSRVILWKDSHLVGYWFPSTSP